MTQRLRASLDALDLSQVDASAWLDINDTTMRRWVRGAAKGGQDAPLAVAMLLAVMIEYKITPAEARKLAGAPALQKRGPADG